MDKIPVSCRMDRDLLARIDKVVESIGDNRSQWIERQLRQCVNESEKSLRLIHLPLIKQFLRASAMNKDVWDLIGAVVGVEQTPEDSERQRQRVLKNLGREGAEEAEAEGGAA